MQTKFENLEKSEVKMTVVLTATELEKYWAGAVKKVTEYVEIDGFRKGHAPEDMIVKKYGEMIVLEEAANLAINETYMQAIIKENEGIKDGEAKLFPITQPTITITKLAKGSDFEYTATFPTMPKIELEDYKSLADKEIKDLLAKEENKKDQEEVTDAEVTEVLENLAKARNPHSHVHADGTVHHEAHDHADVTSSESDSVEGNAPLHEVQGGVGGGFIPQLDDAFAQSFGEEFKTLDDLKNKVKSNLKLEKEAKLIEKKRAVVLEKFIAEAKCDVPDVLLQNELDRMVSQMRGDIEKFGSKWDEYLSHIQKTEEALRTEWADTATKRAKTQLILNEIAKRESLKPTDEEVDVEAIKIMHQVPNANSDNVKDYVYQILLNEKVLKFLGL